MVSRGIQLHSRLIRKSDQVFLGNHITGLKVLATLSSPVAVMNSTPAQ